MRKTEFLRRVRAAKKALRTYSFMNDSYPNVCKVLYNSFDPKTSFPVVVNDGKDWEDIQYFFINISFGNFFGPHTLTEYFHSSCRVNGFDDNICYWLGDLTKENIERREFYLEMWAQWMITFEHYKKIRVYPHVL